jgi:hypothetical protein
MGAVWFAGLFPIGAISDNGDVQGALLAVWTIAVAAAAGTWWILLAPWACTVVILAVDVLNPCEDCRDELGLLGSAFLMALVSILADLGLAIGVGLRKGIALLRARRSGGR